MAKIVVAHKSGRLGNRLILFGHLIAFAEEYGVTIYNPAFEDYSEYFAGTAGRAVSRYPRRTSGKSWHRAEDHALNFRTINFAGRALRRMRLGNSPWSVLSAGHDPEIHGDVELDDEHVRTRLLRSQVTFLFGFRFRCYQLLAKHEDAVRRFFGPSDAVADSVDTVMSRLREKVDYVVGVHIRQSDYREFLGGRFFFGPEHYATMMRAFRDSLPAHKVRFVICSDEGISLSLFTGLDVALGPGDVAQDFFVLADCDYLIATESTFSRWASFLGRVPLLTITDSTTQVEDVQNLRPAPY